MSHHIRCSSCGHWNDGSADHCSECNHHLHAERVERKRARDERAEQSGQGWEVPLIQVKAHYPWYVKPFLYTARAIQVTGLAIGGAIAWSAWWAAA